MNPAVGRAATARTPAWFAAIASEPDCVTVVKTLHAEPIASVRNPHIPRLFTPFTRNRRIVYASFTREILSLNLRRFVSS